MQQLMRIDKSLIPTAAAACARAFYSDPYIVYLLPDNRKRANLRFSFEFYLRMALYGGHEGYTLNTDCKGVAVWSYSEKKEPWDTFFHGGNPLPALRCGMRFMISEMRVSHFCEQLKKKLAPEPHVYLSVLAVDPVHQGKGIASSLVKPMLENLDREGLPCYLETQNIKNVSMYKHFGFENIYEGLVPGIPTPLYVMLRNPVLPGKS